MSQTNMQGIIDQLRPAPQNLDIDSWKLRAVDAISAHFQVDKVNFVSSDGHGGIAQTTRNTCRKSNEAYIEHFYALDPLGFVASDKTGLRLNNGPKSKARVVNLEDVIDRTVLKTSEYYNDFFLPQKISHEAVVYLKTEERLLGVLSVMRETASGFGDSDIAFLRLLEPYLTSCFKNIVMYREKRKLEQVLGLLQAQTFNHPRLQSHFRLSRRETKVIDGIFRGLKNREIAGELFIGETTVKKHIQNICAKMGVNNRTAIIYNILQSLGFVCEKNGN